jgi:hypothetical protein
MMKVSSFDVKSSGSMSEAVLWVCSTSIWDISLSITIITLYFSFEEPHCAPFSNTTIKRRRSAEVLRKNQEKKKVSAIEDAIR